MTLNTLLVNQLFITYSGKIHDISSRLKLRLGSANITNFSQSQIINKSALADIWFLDKLGQF